MKIARITIGTQNGIGDHFEGIVSTDNHRPRNMPSVWIGKGARIVSGSLNRDYNRSSRRAWKSVDLVVEISNPSDQLIHDLREEWELTVEIV